MKLMYCNNQPVYQRNQCYSINQRSLNMYQMDILKDNRYLRDNNIPQGKNPSVDQEDETFLAHSTFH